MTQRLLCLATILGFALSAARAADFTVKVADKEPPAGLDAAIRAKLQSKAVQLLDGAQPVLEFWLASELAIASRAEPAAKALDAVKTATLLGAVSVLKAQRDYRDDELPAGVHTMRLALQPQDGNHLGTSEFAWFAVLVPAKLDTKPDGITDYKALVKASSKETTTDHPVILSLRPAAGAGPEPKLNTPALDHKSVRVSAPARVTGSGEKATLSFEIVYEGMGHK